MDFDFSFNAIMSSFIFGVIGFYLIKEGRKRLNYVWIYLGIALMIYPVLVKGWLLDWGIGFALTYAAYVVR
jgi:hypothetical protein